MSVLSPRRCLSSRRAVPAVGGRKIVLRMGSPQPEGQGRPDATCHDPAPPNPPLPTALPGRPPVLGAGPRRAAGFPRQVRGLREVNCSLAFGTGFQANVLLAHPGFPRAPKGPACAQPPLCLVTQLHLQPVPGALCQRLPPILEHKPFGLRS